MNKQFDLFQKMKIKEVCENISRMTYAYINPDTKQPTVVPSKHYKDILDQPVEVLVNDQVKKQFLNIMFKQMKTLKEEEPILFNETLLLMDLNKTPDSLELNEEAALKITATELVESEKTQKKKFHLVDNAYLDSYEATKNDSELMAQIYKEQQNDCVYSVELDEMEMEKPKSKGGKRMTYNTRIYNYSNLKSEDKQIVQAQLLMFETVEDTITEYMYRRESSTNILDAVSYEEGIKALEQVQQNMFSDIVEYIVYAIDSYEEDVDEVDTQDPLFGLYQEVEDIDNE